MENRQVPALRFQGFTDAWEQRKFSEGISEIGDGLHGTPTYCEDGNIYFINGNNLVDGKIVIGAETKRVDENQQSTADKSLDDTTILMSINGTIGNLAYYSGERLMLGKSAAYIKVSKFDKRFVYAYLQTPSVKRYFMDSLTGTTIKNLGLKVIREMVALIPQDVDEQKRIGEFLNSLDLLITLHQRKYEKLQKVKKSMLGKMFPRNGAKVPEIRFDGFTGAWEQRKAKELFVSTADKGYPDLPVLSATQDRGMIRRDENSINIFHDKKNEAGYKRVLPGQFVIHLRSFQGGFAHSAIEGITSPAYTVFGFSEPEKHDSEYWKYVFTSKAFIRRLETVTYGIRDGRSISYDEFLTLGFVYPSKDEQTAIAQYLDKLSDLITLHQRELEKLKNIKKSMLEKMFV